MDNDGLREDAKVLLVPWLSHPRAMCYLHAVALKRTFVPYDGNNNFRKVTASVLVFVWGTITLGIAFGVAQLGVIMYGAMTAVVYTIIGVQWGFEIVGIAPKIEIDYRDGRESDDD
jgi:hypothetical protein